MSETRSRRSRERKSTAAEILAIAAAVILVLVLGGGAGSTYEMVTALTEQANESTYFSSVLARLEALTSKAADAQNEQRAYMQNPDPRRLKGFDDARAGIQSEYEAALKLTNEDRPTQIEIQAAKAQTDKALDTVRDAIDYQRTGQGEHALAFLAQSGSLTGTFKEAIGPIRQKFEAALLQSRNKPRDVASRMANWVLATWILAALVGVGIAVLAIRQARAAGHLHRRLRRESIFDALTGLPNSVYLDEWLTRSIARASRTSLKVAVLFVDINNFKQVNHGLGYSEGNRVLLEVSEKLRSITRSSDFVARVRNDSFAIVMPDVTDMQQVESAMNRFTGLNVVRAGIAIKTTVGSAVFPEDAESADNLLRLSRAAMYRNRQSRRAT
ncbi:MAG: diguanylate cyclase domain-containing protein [Burkholderiales bacterium]